MGWAVGGCSRSVRDYAREMAITLAEERQLECPRCGTSSGVPLWLAIDVRERPDLRPIIANATTYTLRCLACGHVTDRDEVIVVTNLDPVVPVVLGRPSTQPLEAPLPPAAEVLLTHVHEQVRACDEPIAWPMMTCSFSVLRAASQRDVGADLAAPGQAAQHVEERHPGQGPNYRRLLSAIQASAAERRMNLAIDSLHRIVSRTDLEAALQRFPELLSPAVRDQLERDAAGLEREEERRFVEAELDLLGAWQHGDRQATWDRYEQALQETMEISIIPELWQLMEALDAVVERDPVQVVEIGERLLQRATYARRDDIEALASVRTAIGHLQLRDDDRGARLERGIALLERADALLRRLPTVGDVNDRRQTLANLAAAYGDRIEFDPIVNQRRAIELHRGLLEEVGINDDGDLWAKTHTHLATSLLALARATGTRDGEGRVAGLAEILDHHEQALQWRTYERNPLDWAYTQVNLATAHAEGGGSLEQAIEHYDRAEQGFGAADVEALREQAIVGRAGARLSMAMRSGVRRVERVALASEAEAEAHGSALQLSARGHRLAAGAAWWQVARAWAIVDPDSIQARQALVECLIHATPENAPDRCLAAAEALAVLCERAKAPDAAAEAWRIATDAAAATIQLPATREGRLTAVASVAHVFAQAALALVEIDRVMDAVDVLELGRARELAAWLERDIVELDELRLLAPALARRYEDLRRQIDATERTGAGAGDEGLARVVEGLADAVQQIRDVPGHGAFLRRPSLAELADGSVGRHTLAYPLVGDQRSCWALVEAGDSATVSLIDLPGLSAGDVDRVMGGEGQQAGGYLDARADADRLDAQIEGASAALGATLMKPLADELARRGCDEVCIVALGLLGLLPLHALTWSEDDVCLIDILPVAYAPSGYARLLCARRALTRGAVQKLVSVGDPTDDLDYAEGEARMVCDTVPAQDIVLLIRDAATKTALVSSVRGATHVHLACHGSAALTPDAMDSALWLAGDEALAARDVVSLELETARLVVASACESGLISSLAAADEALALSTVLIGAGAAGVVSSLWKVDDQAAAMLMTRFYDELNRHRSPASALRTAILWLRDAADDELAGFWERHPELRGAAATTRFAHTRDPRPTPPFSAPTMWAAFVFSGA